MLRQSLTSMGIPASFISILVSIAIFVCVTVGTYLVGRFLVNRVLSQILKKRGLSKHARKPILKLLNVLSVLLAVMVAFGAAGFGNFLAALTTISAAGTLAVGFAMQDVLKNFVSGVFIFTDRPFEIGDWIEWSGGSGTVEDISFRVTRVRTFDNELLTVPNSELTTATVKNYTDSDELRIKALFGVGYEDDIEQATDIILEEARNHDGIMDTPDPSIRLTELADSYVGLQARIWIADPSRADFVRTKAELMTNVKQRFDEEDINIPYPQTELSGSITV